MAVERRTVGERDEHRIGLCQLALMPSIWRGRPGCSRGPGNLRRPPQAAGRAAARIDRCRDNRQATVRRFQDVHNPDEFVPLQSGPRAR